MSLFKRKDSPYWWVKLNHKGRRLQQSTGTADNAKAQEYHDKLKASLWDQERLGIKPESDLERSGCAVSGGNVAQGIAGRRTRRTCGGWIGSWAA